MELIRFIQLGLWYIHETQSGNIVRLGLVITIESRYLLSLKMLLCSLKKKYYVALQ